MDSHPPDTEAGRWLTYRQIADLRRISKASAERLVRRHRWRRQEDNQGITRALVPPDWAEPTRPLPPDIRTDDRPDIRADGRPDVTPATVVLEAALAAVREAHAGEIGALRERAEAAERRVDAADADRRAAIALAEQTMAVLKEAEARVAAESGRADMLRDRLNAMQEQLADAHAALQAAEAGDARTARAETDRDEERARADDLRAQIDAFNAELVVMRAEADRALAEERLRAERLNEQVEALSAEVMRADAAGRDKERAEAEREVERARADALRDRIEALQEQLAVRQEGADATGAIRQAEAMVDGLREAHAGEVSALKAERHRLATQIDGFATRADQAEARTDSLRARVDVLQRERDAARAEAQEVAQAAEALRLEEEETRKARGLLARLRAAWRGE
jgi:chromosome segregation ATPase